MVKCISTAGLCGQGRVVPTFANDNTFGALTIYGYANAPFGNEVKNLEKVATGLKEAKREKRLEWKRQWRKRKKAEMATQGLTTKGKRRLTKAERRVIHLKQRRQVG